MHKRSASGKISFTKHVLFAAALLCFCSYICSCTTTKISESPADEIKTSENVFSGTDSVLFTFAGDIMAHRPNYSHKPYSAIYEDIKPVLKESVLCFANIEAPVDNSKEYSTYPNFNMNGEYVEAAVDAGFNVFSLVNNHTSDQGLEGIKATRKYFSELEKKTADSERPVYACGIKEKSSGPLTWRLIPCRAENGAEWKILFVAVTEIVNRPDNRSWFDFTGTGKASREKFVAELKELRTQNPCDLFILSFHCAEPEYVLTTEESQKNYYHELLKNGVDVVWANHPHVAKEWELTGEKEKSPSKMIFYAQGNTISAQRWEPQFKSPQGEREYTGDGYITQVRFMRNKDGIHIAYVNPVLITTYITPEWQFVIRRLNDDFIAFLRENGQKTWAAYMESRKTLMEKIKGKITWQ